MTRAGLVVHLGGLETGTKATQKKKSNDTILGPLAANQANGKIYSCLPETCHVGKK